MNQPSIAHRPEDGPGKPRPGLHPPLTMPPLTVPPLTVPPAQDHLDEKQDGHPG
jgi:hypothetical protein